VGTTGKLGSFVQFFSYVELLEELKGDGRIILKLVVKVM
jgi:hypothetical protein